MNEKIPDLENYIQDTFGETGFFSKAFSEYSLRTGQLQLTEAIDNSIIFEENLLAEGPCGIGKSLAYLVPASYHAWKSESQIVVVTGNISLQEQLITKDLPLLRKILPWPFTYGLLKGKNNYLCLSKHEERESTGFAGNWTPGEWDEIRSVRQWAQLTIQKKQRNLPVLGDISEIEFQPSNKIWNQFSVSAEECKGSDCKQYKKCFAVQAQRSAKEADIIVTNYHLLFSNVKLMLTGAEGRILPPFETLIADEVHLMAGIARDFLGFRITKEMFHRAANAIKNSRESVVVTNCADVLFENLRDYKQSPRYKIRIKERLIDLKLFSKTFEDLSQACDACTRSYFLEIKTLEEELEKLSYQFGDDDPNVLDLIEKINSIGKKSDRLKELTSQTRLILEFERSEQNIYFIELEGNGKFPVLGAKPIFVADALRDTIFKEVSTFVGVSATVATNSNFDYIAKEIGIPNYNGLIVESPFDWSKQAMLVLPEDMTDPSDREAFGFSVAAKVGEIINLAKGRTLGLFTSYKNLDLTYETIKNNGKYKVLKQGQGNRLKLIEEFKKNVNSVLLGTESFWAGVDVPGEALSAVVIDRLPFPSPEDPILDAIQARDSKSAFASYSIPHAVIALKQGVGRLIRSIKDRGVVIILDTRIRTKSYRNQFLTSLPAMPIVVGLDAIREFLDRPTGVPKELEEDIFE